MLYRQYVNTVSIFTVLSSTIFFSSERGYPVTPALERQKTGKYIYGACQVCISTLQKELNFYVIICYL